MAAITHGGGAEFRSIGQLVVKSGDYASHQFTGIDPAKYKRYKITGWFHVKAGSGNRAMDFELNAASPVHGRSNVTNLSDAQVESHSAVTTDVRVALGTADRVSHFELIIWVEAGRRIKCLSKHWTDSDGSTTEPSFATFAGDFNDTTIADVELISDTEGSVFDEGEFQLWAAVN